MIEWLNGSVEHVEKQHIVLNVHGIGIAILVPDGYRFEQKSLVNILTYVHWNAEQGPSIFGFSSALERSIFSLIIGCSGIGPKLALAVLGQLSTTSIINAINSQNYSIFATVSGIGTKKAEALVVQLKHKIGTLAQHITQDQPDLLPWQELAMALESLNYSRTEVSAATHAVRTSTLPDNPTFDFLLRKALMYLTKQS
jgi:holliday junction DNA helicase RuvA